MIEPGQDNYPETESYLGGSALAGLHRLNPLLVAITSLQVEFVLNLLASLDVQDLDKLLSYFIADMTTHADPLASRQL